jgi:hypothetical protein
VFAGCGQAVVPTKRKPVAAVVTKPTARSAKSAATAVTSCPTPSLSGSPAETQLLASILTGFPTCVLSLQVMDSTPAGMFVEPGAPGWLVATFSSDTSFAAQAVARWGAAVIAGAYDSQCAAKQAVCIGGISTVGSGSGPVSGAATSTIDFQAVSQPVSSEASVLSTIDANAQDLGVSVDSVSFVQANGLVPIVVVQVPSDTSVTVFQHGSLFGSLSLVGSLVELEDGSGTPLVVDGNSPRTQSFAGWIGP